MHWELKACSISQDGSCRTFSSWEPASKGEDSLKVRAYPKVGCWGNGLERVCLFVLQIICLPSFWVLRLHATHLSGATYILDKDEVRHWRGKGK